MICRSARSVLLVSIALGFVGGPGNPVGQEVGHAAEPSGFAVTDSLLQLAPMSREIDPSLGCLLFSSLEYRQGWQTWLATARNDGYIIGYYTRDGQVRGASWSPNGVELAYGYEGYAGKGSGIYIAAADGSKVVQVVSGRCWDPSWSPDGTRIVFVSDRDGHPDLYIVSIDGSRLVRLTDTVAEEGHPDWSPDGSRIAFDLMPVPSRDDFSHVYRGIYVMDESGSGITKLAEDEHGEVEFVGPRWSPDGKLIVFFSRCAVVKEKEQGFSSKTGVRYLVEWVGEEGDIWTVAPENSTELKQVTNDHKASWPVWSPDGSRVAYVPPMGQLPGRVKILELATGHVTEITSGGPLSYLRLPLQVLDWRSLPKALPFYGKWKVAEPIDIGGVMDNGSDSERQEEAKRIVGTVVEFWPDEVRYRGRILHHPVYIIYCNTPKGRVWPPVSIVDARGQETGLLDYKGLGFESPPDVWRVEARELYEDGVVRPWLCDPTADVDEPCLAKPVTLFFVDSNGKMVFYGEHGFYRAEKQELLDSSKETGMTTQTDASESAYVQIFAVLECKVDLT